MTAITPTAPRSARERKSRHPVDEVLPIPKLAAYGLQHVMAFYAGAVLVPILLAGALQLTPAQLIHLINADLFTCGIASIIQAAGVWKIGVRLPLLQGVTFTAVSPMIAIGTAAGGGTQGLVTIYGSVIVAGLFTFFAAPFFARLVRFFPPVVTGSVILIIGIALLPVAAGDVVRSFGPQDLRGNGMYTKLADGTFALQPAVQLKDIGYALGTLLIIVLIQRFFKGFLATVAVLIGLVVGTLGAWALGDAHFDEVAQSDWLGYTAPFHFGAPKFAITAILSMIVVMLITMVETTGDVYATGEIVQKRIKGDDIARAIRADGLATTLGGVLNSFPYTCFAENVGLVRLTQIKSRWVVVSAGVIMIILGSLPKAAAIVAGIPSPVLGGAALAMFAAVAVVGIQTLQKVDFNDHRNIVIVGTSVGLGMLVTAQPYISNAFPHWAQIFFGSGITLGAILAIVLNLVFNHLGGSRGPAVAGRPGQGLIKLADVNAMSIEQFSATFSEVVQGNSWALDRAYQAKPFADTFALRAAFHDALLIGTDAEQRLLLLSFPDLGSEDVDGRENAVDHALGLGTMADEDHGEVHRAAVTYRERYGFPWIVCARDVGNYSKLVENAWARMNNAPSVERATALVEISKIVNYRFNELIADANPIASARGDNLPRSPVSAEPALGRQNPGMTEDHVAEFNALPEREAAAHLHSCLAVPRWVEEMLAGRPYVDGRELRDRARQRAATLSVTEVEAALARHPRIGERAGAAHDAAFSEREQASMGAADQGVQAAIRVGNLAYESRFGRVFLIRAHGRTPAEILIELNRRLANDEAAETAEVVTQLGEIALGRLDHLVSG